MSTIKANAYLDAAGGNTATINGATPVGTDTVQTLTNKSIDAGQLTGDVAAARITTALNASGSAPIYACRAWVNFNGTGTVAIRGSGNVTSITDNGVGDYTVNFTTAMPNANYSYAISGSADNTGGSGNRSCFFVLSRATSSIRIFSASNLSGAAQDFLEVSVSIVC
jgi:hypothetical protein